MDEQQMNETQQPFDFDKERYKNRNNGNLIGGLILITLGVLFLIDRFVPHINFGDLWPVILIIAGVALLSNSFIKPKKPSDEL